MNGKQRPYCEVWFESGGHGWIARVGERISDPQDSRAKALGWVMEQVNRVHAPQAPRRIGDVQMRVRATVPEHGLVQALKYGDEGVVAEWLASLALVDAPDRGEAIRAAADALYGEYCRLSREAADRQEAPVTRERVRGLVREAVAEVETLLRHRDWPDRAATLPGLAATIDVLVRLHAQLAEAERRARPGPPPGREWRTFGND